MKRSLSYLFLLTVLLASISGCQKQTLNKLDGTWTLIPISDPYTLVVEEWTFKGGDFEILRDGELWEEGTYTLNSTFIETTLDLQPTRDATFIRHYTGEWKIHEIKQTHMTLLHFIEDDHGMTVREFERD